VFIILLVWQRRNVLTNIFSGTKSREGDDEDEKNKESGKPARSHRRRSACRLERALNISRACVRVLFLLFIEEREYVCFNFVMKKKKIWDACERVKKENPRRRVRKARI
jgi:hypothetical protein